MRVVVKIGTSSLTADSGALELQAVKRISSQISKVVESGVSVTLVTSGAISAGLPLLGFVGERPKDTATLQVAAAVGQSRLMQAYNDSLGLEGLTAGQILLSARDFIDRRQYLHARSTLNRMLAMGVIPVVNENDAVCDDEIRWGDNDRLAALVAHALGADLLVLLTDTDGLYTADPRVEPSASLVSEVVELDEELGRGAGRPGTKRGSGGMASKLFACKMAAHAGISAVIANASRRNVVEDAISGHDVGTRFVAAKQSISARKLWIAYALEATGRIRIDDGAVRALVVDGRSLLRPGISNVERQFLEGDGVEVVDSNNTVLAKGIARTSSDELELAAPEATSLVIHRDDLVLL